MGITQRYAHNDAQHATTLRRFIEVVKQTFERKVKGS